MVNDLRTETAPVTTLVTGIVNDAQQLIKQQLNLFQIELHQGFEKTKDAALPLALCVAMAGAGFLLLGIMLAELLHWGWPEFPLWAGFAVAGCILIAAATCLFFVGKRKFDAIRAAPDKAVETLKENVQWLTKN